MKKHLLIALVIFVAVTSMALASNFIPWDETPLEQTIFALPLGIGLFLEVPFLAILGSVDPDANYVSYQLSWIVIPFVAGLFYSGVAYGVMRRFARR